MLLAVDIGNTTSVVGFFEGEELKYRYSTRSDYGHSREEISSSFSLFLKDKGIAKEELKEAIISSVVPSLGVIWKEILKENYGIRPFVLGPRLKTGIAVRTDNPKEVGSDLIADAIGAKALYEEDVLIADLGTANKIILLGKGGAFEGCTIGVGLGMAAKALASDTAALPDVSLEIPAKVLGKNTADSMNSALTYGFAAEIRGLCDMIEKEAGRPLKRVLTGGYGYRLNSLLPEFEFVPSLLLDGLRIAYSLNHK